MKTRCLRPLFPSIASGHCLSSTLLAFYAADTYNHITKYLVKGLLTYLDILGEEVALENLAEGHVDPVIGGRRVGFPRQLVLDDLEQVLRENQVHLPRLSTYNSDESFG